MKKEESFEKSMERLEEIVRALEDGSAPLDASLKLFEEGTALVRRCSDRLDAAEQRVKILMKKTDGTYDEQPFTDPAQ